MAKDPPGGGASPEELAVAKQLSATRSLGIAAYELGPLVSRRGLGDSLCAFGLAFAGSAIGLRDAVPGAFDLPIFLTVIGFGAFLVLLGTPVAIFQAKVSLPPKRALAIERLAVRSLIISDIASKANTGSGVVVRAIRGAASLEELEAQLAITPGGLDDIATSAAPGENSFLDELDDIRTAFGQLPLKSRSRRAELGTSS
jgi:hypothetical protein